MGKRCQISPSVVAVEPGSGGGPTQGSWLAHSSGHVCRCSLAERDKAAASCLDPPCLRRGDLTLFRVSFLFFYKNNSKGYI
jgi:hypothetical protein